MMLKGTDRRCGLHASVFDASAMRASLPLLLCAWFIGRTPTAAADGALIYRCETASGLVFADRPCGDDALTVPLDRDAINTYSPAATAAPQLSKSSVASRAKVARPRLAYPSDNRRCTALRSRIARLDARMRQGYDVRMGERLREERRVATRALVDQGCR